MTDRYDELERLLAAATPRPWTYDTHEESRPQGTWKVARIRGQEDLPWPLGGSSPKKSLLTQESWYVFPKDADLSLIVVAVNALPDLLAERRRLREALESTLPTLTHGRRSEHERQICITCGVRERVIQALAEAQPKEAVIGKPRSSGPPHNDQGIPM